MLFDLRDGINNPFEFAVIQSEEYADRVIEQFKNQYTEDEDPNSLLHAIVFNMGLSNSDFMPDDIRRIENEISRYVEEF
jgi:hypothetical protein